MIRLVILTAAIAAAQEPPPTFHSGIQLVQVSVIAQDKQGKPVADLRREDFQILDNNSPREIALFAAEADNAAPSGPELKAPGMFSNRIAASAAAHTGYSVILLDNLFTDVVRAGCGPREGCPPNEAGSANARLQALRTLRSIPAGEKIALYATGRSLQVISDFTADRDLLERQLTLWKPSVDTQNAYLIGFGPGCPLFDDEAMLLDYAQAVAGAKTSQPADGGAQATVNAGGGKPEPTLSQTPNWAAQYQGTLIRNCIDATRQDTIRRASASNDEMVAIADHLAGIPGRKKLIWLSNRFVISPRALRKLSGAGVAIYPVDVDGVSCGGPEPECLHSRPLSLMDGIAAQTGGVAYYQRNDLDGAIREAMDDGRVSYTLGFYRSDDDRPSQVHQIGVRVARPGITLRYRTSYETEAPRAPSGPPKTDLAKAFERPVDATAVAIRATVTRRAHDRLELQAVVDAGSLELTQNRDRRTGKIEIVGRFMAADGKPEGDLVSQTLNLNLTGTTYETVRQQGIAYHNVLPIPPKAVEFRLLFANPASGKIGTLTIPLSEVLPNEAK